MAPLPCLFSSALLASSLAYAAATPLLSAYYPAHTPGADVKFAYTNYAYYFVEVTTPTGFILPPDQPLSGLKKFVNDAYDKGVLPIVTIGGWTGSRYWSELIATSEGRTNLSSQIQKYLYESKFKGVDISWEYPDFQGIGCNTISPNDTKNFLLFLQTLRGWLGTGYLISASVSPNGLYVGTGTQLQPLKDVTGFSNVLDHLNIMTYDYTGSWAKTTGPSSPLHSCQSGGGVVAAVNSWTKAGFPAGKIFISIPSYGYSFVTSSSQLATVTTTHGDGDGDNLKYISYLYQNWTSIPKGEASDSNAKKTDVCGNVTTGYTGQWHYTTLVKEGLLSPDGGKGLNGFQRYFDACTQTPFLFNPVTRHMITYEDATSAGIKAAWAKQQGLKGIAIFSSEGFDNAVYDRIATQLGSKKNTD